MKQILVIATSLILAATPLSQAYAASSVSLPTPEEINGLMMDHQAGAFELVVFLFLMSIMSFSMGAAAYDGGKEEAVASARPEPATAEEVEVAEPEEDSDSAEDDE